MGSQCEHVKSPVYEDKFVKRMEIVHTLRDKKKSHILEGWYSKEDMVKELKWNPTLVHDSSLEEYGASCLTP